MGRLTPRTVEAGQLSAAAPGSSCAMARGAAEVQPLTRERSDRLRDSADRLRAVEERVRLLSTPLL